MSLRFLFNEISRLLTPGEKRRWKRCMLAVAVSSMLDFFGIASLLPLLHYLMSDGDNRNAALLFGCLSVFFIATKGMAGMWLRRYQSAYLQGLFNRLSLSLYRDSFARGVLFVRSHGISRIGHEITWVCHVFCQNLLGTLMRLTGDVLLVALVSAAVIAVAPVSALILGAPLAAVALLCRKIIGEKARREGDTELQARRRLTTTINDTFGGLADIMVTGSYPSFEKEFSSTLGDITRSRLKMEVYNGAALPFCELAVAVSLSAMAFIGSGDSTKMALGLFAVAAFRLIPAIRGIIWGSMQIKNASASIETIQRLGKPVDFSHSSADKKAKGCAGRAKFAAGCSPSDISIDNISFRFKDDGKPVINDFSCHIEEGEYIGIRGESGVGKSTLFNIILGLIEPDKGRVAIGVDTPQNVGLDNWIKRFGYVPQDVFVFNATVTANVAPGSERQDREAIEHVLREVRLDKWLESLPEGTDTILGERGLTLSGGERQRLGLARALYRNCAVLLLDEATSALDTDTEREILEIVRNARSRRNLTVVSIAHRETSLRHCSRIISMQ